MLFRTAGARAHLEIDGLVDALGHPLVEDDRVLVLLPIFGRLQHVDALLAEGAHLEAVLRENAAQVCDLAEREAEHANGILLRHGDCVLGGF